MTEETRPTAIRPAPVEAICPDCHLELTGSKMVERVRPSPKHQDPSYVFYCPECGRFFTSEGPVPRPEPGRP